MFIHDVFAIEGLFKTLTAHGAVTKNGQNPEHPQKNADATAENKGDCTTFPGAKGLDGTVDAPQEGLVVVLVMVLVVVLMMFVVVIMVILRIFAAVWVSPGFALLVQFSWAMEHDARITHTDDVDWTGSGQFGISTDEWQPERMAECVGQADSFLAQRGSAKVMAFAFSMGRGKDRVRGVDNVSDVVIIAVYVGVCQRMTKANVGIRIRWTIDDADRLSCNEANCARSS